MADNNLLGLLGGASNSPTRTNGLLGAAPSALGNLLAQSVGQPVQKSGMPIGMIEPGNINLATRPVVRNADGSISTVRSIGVNIGGKELLIPTVSDDGRILEPRDAVDLYRRTGRHLGVFNSPDASTEYAKALHLQQQAMYSKD